MKKNQGKDPGSDRMTEQDRGLQIGNHRRQRGVQEDGRRAKPTLKAVLTWVVWLLLPVLPAMASTFTLTTPLNNNNLLRGIMFDVTATNTLTVRRIDSTMALGGVGPFEIYYRPGTYVGHEENATGWTLVGTTAPLVPLGVSIPTPIPLDVDLVIPAGQTYAFYVTTTTALAGTSYTTGFNPGGLLASDANLTIFEGAGKDYPFDRTVPARRFNGRFHYDLGGSIVSVIPTPTELAAPGGSVSYAVTVRNIDGTSGTLSDLDDSLLGSLNGVGTCALPQALGANGTYNCSFTASVSGASGTTATRTVSAMGTSGGIAFNSSDQATVDLVAGAVGISLTKTASPAMVSEPGGPVTFTARVDNTGGDSVNLTSLVDDIHGNLDGQGDCALPQTVAVTSFYQCSFTVTVAGAPGTIEVDTITADGMSNGMPVTAEDSATVTITDTPSSLALTHSASPTALPEPAGNVTYTVRVDNTSTADSITITSLVDDVHGDLNGQGDCSLPQSLAPGVFYQCQFTALVSGNAGDNATDTVTASGTDDDGNPVSAQDSATVTFTDLLPNATVTKTASPTTIDEPGGNVTFSVVVANTGTEESLNLTALVDDIHGDLNGQGDCSVPQTLAASGSYSCSFTVAVNGNAGDTETDTVTATLSDDDGNTIHPSDSAMVTITDVAASLTVTHTASPTALPEPGGNVSFTIRVDNTSTADSVTMTSLVDDVHGDLNGQGDCSLPQSLAPGAFYQCQFTAAVSGNAGDNETDTVTASGTDDDGNPVSAQDSATVTFTDLLPTATVTNTASPTTVDEPGGNVTFSMVVANTGTEESLDLTALVDDIHGDLNGQGDCSVPQTLAASGTYSCSFTVAVNGNAGDTETDTATATLSDDDGNTIHPSDSATVTITDVAASLTVTHSASPTALPEPGGNVSFTLRVDNTSTADSITITSLVDDVHGDLNGQGDCSLPQSLAPGAFYQCQFTAAVSGNAGDNATDTVTASGIDDDGNPVSAQDSATVTFTDLLPTATVTKTASPTSVDEPGGNVTFSVVVTNTGTEESLNLTALVDDIHGDLNGQGDCSVPQTLAASGTYSCSFTVAVNGNAGDTETDTATATLSDDDGNTIHPSDSATVTITDVAASLTVTHSASPTALPEPAGNVTYTVRVDNTSTADSITLTSLVDDVHGDLNGQGDCSVPQSLTPGAFYQCQFTATVSGNAGDNATDTVTALGTDDDGNPVSAQDSATVTFTDLLPTATVTKTASPTSVDEPGGNVTFSVVVTNTGTEEPLNLTALVDDIHGDLNGQGDCSVPQTLAASGTYSCSFTVAVNGNAGDTETDTVTATLSDDDGNTIHPSDSATVTITDVAASLTVTHSASPTALPEPGGNISFTVRVDNTSTADSITITLLVDDIHGDLNGQGDCSLPQTLAPGAFYQCPFTAAVSGNAGDNATDTVTASGTDDDGNPVSAQDSATVTFTDLLPTATVTKTASPTTVDEPGGNVTFSVVVTNMGTEESLDLTALVDDIHGDLNGQGDCSAPQTLAASGTYSCSFTVAVNGNAGDTETDTVTATLSDDDGNTIHPSDSATVTITDLVGSLAVTHTASPTALPEPGGNISFTVRVDNTSIADSVTVASLVDDIHGDLNGQGDCSLPQSLAPGAFYQCQFTAAVSGNAGDNATDTVTASGTDDDGNPVSAQDSATITFTDLLPTATVTNTASPTTVDEPGGNVTFSVVVANTGTEESLDLTALVDNIHGDLNGQGDCSVPQTLTASGTYSCSFTVAVNGNAGDTETDTVTATLSDDDGNTIHPSDSATVTITGTDWGDAPDPSFPTLLANDGARHTIVFGFFLGSGVDAEADGLPNAAANGDDTDGNDDEDGVSFAGPLVLGTTVNVDITASQAGVLDAWIDFDGSGSWDETGEKVFDGQALVAGTNLLSVDVPTTAATGETVARFRLTSAGIDTPAGLATDGEVEDLLLDVESLSISVTHTAVPTTLPEPGGTATFTVRVDNTGTADVQLTSLVDDVTGDLNGVGACAVPQTIPVGGHYSCTFTAGVNGNAGLSQIATVTASGTSISVPVSAQDSATVVITDVAPAVDVTKTASPTSVAEPGGNVTFSVVVANLGSVESVDLTALMDDVHGNLNGQGDCAVPQTVAPSTSYSCSFTAAVNGNAGHVDTTLVTATLSDDDGNTIAPSDSASVTITDVASSIEVSQMAAPSTVDEPGGDVTFTVRVDNTSAVDLVTITSLSDDTHGDLNGLGNCSVPQAIVADGFYLCTFTTTVSGNAGDSEMSLIIASGIDDDGQPVSAQDSAIVSIADVPPTATITNTAAPSTVDEPGGEVNFSVEVTNTGTAEPLDLTDLVDGVHGDLNGQGDCAVPQSIAPDASYTCSFMVTVSGNADDEETFTITATLADDDGNTISPSDSATVTLTGTDWGDAPDPTYPTLLSSNGARHTIVAGFFLGSGVDAEADGRPSPEADGDDHDGPGSDDEDGVSFGGPLLPGSTLDIDVTASMAGMLDAWIDFDGNGSWADAGEKIFDSVSVAAGTNSLSATLPASFAPELQARFRLSSSGGLSFDGAAPDGEVEDYLIVTDSDAPQVAFIGSAPDTGDGQILPCESTRVAISEIQVVFDELMRTGGGAASADDLAGYRLLAPGPDSGFDTASCGPVEGDDVLLALTDVTYLSDTPVTQQSTATLRLAEALDDDHVRLLVCGTLEDTAGNSLEGGDFSLDFRVDAFNLFQNGHFDCDLGGWVQEPASSGQLEHALIDADSSTDSGSLEAMLFQADPVAVAQCVPVAPLTTFEFGGWFRVDAQASQLTGLVRQCRFFNQSECAGAEIASVTHADLIADTALSFVHRTTVTEVASTAASALCLFELRPLQSVSPVVYIDQLFARTSAGGLFADGFESGDTSSWTSTTP